MSQENDIPKQSTTSSLRVCRGCLDTDARLYDMRQNRLSEAYATLLSTATVQVTDDLPQYLCSYCAVLLLKCNTFRMQCIDSLIVLRNATQQQDLTVGHIKNIDRPIYFKKSELEWNNIEDINLKQKQNCSDISTDRPAIFNNVDSVAEIRHLIKNEDIELDVPQDESFFETQCDKINETSDSEDDIAIADLKLDSRASKCKNNQKNTIRNRKTVEFFVMRYNTEVRHLSKEEQIKKILDRKKSANYKYGQFKCNFCFRAFLAEETYKNHMSLHDDISGNFVCDICKCHLLTKEKLAAHQLAHSRVFTCKECGYRTKFVSKVNEHHKYHNGKNFTCEDCGKEFKKKASKFNHIKKCHPASEQLVRCEICGDSFNGPAGLKYHDNKSHKEMYSPECLCSGCDTQFYCSAAFKAHQGTDGLCDATHKYCVRCGMAFETEQLLKEHEIEQRKPQNHFECDMCCKTYKLFSSFKLHQRRHSDTHLNFIKKYEKKSNVRNQYKNDSDTKSMKAHNYQHTKEGPYKCKHCSNSYNKPSHLARHNLVHTGERLYTCDICGENYKTKCYLKIHIQKVHVKIPVRR